MSHLSMIKSTPSGGSRVVYIFVYITKSVFSLTSNHIFVHFNHYYAFYSVNKWCAQRFMEFKDKILKPKVQNEDEFILIISWIDRWYHIGIQFTDKQLSMICDPCISGWSIVTRIPGWLTDTSLPGWARWCPHPPGAPPGSPPGIPGTPASPDSGSGWTPLRHSWLQYWLPPKHHRSSSSAGYPWSGHKHYFWLLYLYTAQVLLVVVLFSSTTYQIYIMCVCYIIN